MIRRRFLPFVVAFAMTVAVPAAALAQSGNSTISGIVKDSSGGAIPGAQVTVVNEDTNVSVDTVTNEQGLYHPNLRSGEPASV